MSIFQRLFKSAAPPPEVAAEGQVLTVEDLEAYAYAGQQVQAPWQESLFDGEKFYGGFGNTQMLRKDYATLRQRSAQLFEENLYARGLIRRIVTNEINTGLMPEATPYESILGLPDESLQDWTEDVESRYELWAATPEMCDFERRRTMGEIQRDARLESFIEGDVLVVLRPNRRTGIPAVQLIPGRAVMSPLVSQHPPGSTVEIREGVEVDDKGRHLAFWVRQKDGEIKRLPAYGVRSGRRTAWLMYGTEKRVDEVRGTPLLSIVLQSLKEIDRYRDSTQRKAVINSILAMFIKKTEDKPGTLPLTGGAVRRDTVVSTGTAEATRSFTMTKQLPGAVLEELQHGEEPVQMNGSGTDTNFAEFEEAVLRGIAWACEIPPEILLLSFSNNYSASQAAINEFKIYLSLSWTRIGEMLCTPIYKDWLLSEVLRHRVSAPGFLAAWRDVAQQDTLAAWTSVEWNGAIKPSTDMLKQVKAAKELIDGGFSNRAREARTMTGTKYSRNIKRLKRENEQWAEARRPIAEFLAEFGQSAEQLDDESGGGRGNDHSPEALTSVLIEALDSADVNGEFIEGFLEVLENAG